MLQIWFGRYGGMRSHVRKMPITTFKAAVALLALLAVRFGFELPWPALDVALVVIGFAYAVLLMLPSKDASFLEVLSMDRWTTFFTGVFALLTALLLLLAALGTIPVSSLGSLVFSVSVGYLSLIGFRLFLSHLGSWVINTFPPPAILAVTLGIVIIIGTILLSMPGATTSPIGFLDAFFTSTSATCVTGLIVLDTGGAFTTFGQVIILTMIQIGGLGLMTFVAFFALFLGHRVGLRENVSFTRVVDSEFVSDLRKVLASIIGWTLTIEAIGAFILVTIWRTLRPTWTFVKVLWHSIFHSVSSFCNAGFSLNTTNLEFYQTSPATCFIVGSLIVLGGLGFVVLTVTAARLVGRIKTGRSERLPLQARFVIILTAVLIGLALVVFLVLEWNNTLAGMTFTQKVSNAFLEAVTPRTAGFNTVPTASLSGAVKWLFVILMFVGASPGGTGGGVKTSTVGLMFVGFRSLLRHRPQPELWSRRIPSYDFQRAAVVIVLGVLLFAFSSVLILYTERASLASGQRGPLDFIFETMSAFGTVGLSTGVTPELTHLGRLIIIFTMFLGRIGPATIATATGRWQKLKYRYPEARITIG
ncbi:Trk family potassium uptake protein [Candidatus Fermentibacteria bacterium]|nr:Trk family potassium uptake protein [Candidatus Fermentibacteria bacterium]